MSHRREFRPAAARPLGLLLMLGALAAPAAGQAPPATPKRDWTAAPAVVEVDTKDKQDIYALGDVHGDYNRMVKLLAAGKLIAPDPASPGQAAWTGGDAVLVCTGDLIDKDDHALDVIAFFRAIGKQAEAAGGKVIVTMGNHEAEFLASPNDDSKAEQFLKELQGAGITPTQVASGTDKLDAGKFLLAMPIAARVDDWFFCHAGNTNGLSIGDLSRAIQDGVDQSGYGAPILRDPGSLLEARMHPDPWWADQDHHVDPSQLGDRIRQLGGINHLVFGHQPGDVKVDGKKVRHKGVLTQLYDGLVFLIDVGMSNKIDDSHGFLLRVHKKHAEASVIDPDGDATKIWAQP